MKNFREYVELYLAGQNPEDADEEGIPRKVVHEVVNPRWEVCITASDAGFQQASFVNSIATTKVGMQGSTAGSMRSTFDWEKNVYGRGLKVLLESERVHVHKLYVYDTIVMVTGVMHY